MTSRDEISWVESRLEGEWSNRSQDFWRTPGVRSGTIEGVKQKKPRTHKPMLIAWRPPWLGFVDLSQVDKGYQWL